MLSVFLSDLTDRQLNGISKKPVVIHSVVDFPFRYVGIREFNLSLIQIRDLELLKQAVVKDFDHFVDHHVTLDEKADSVLGNNLFSLRGLLIIAKSVLNFDINLAYVPRR
jgi:hypothetical protein